VWRRNTISDGPSTLPRHLRLRGVRADAGFCLPELLALWEQLKMPYVVVASLSQPIQKIIKGDLKWTAFLRTRAWARSWWPDTTVLNHRPAIVSLSMRNRHAIALGICACFTL